MIILHLSSLMDINVMMIIITTIKRTHGIVVVLLVLSFNNLMEAMGNVKNKLIIKIILSSIPMIIIITVP